MLLVLALAWRLNTGPISLEFARTMITEALQPSDLPISVKIGEPIIIWGGWRRLFDVTVDGIQLTGYNNSVTVTAPRISLQLSVRALLEGVAAPVRVSVDEPVVTITETFAATGGNGSARSLASLVHPPDYDHPLARLDSLVLRNAHFSLPATMINGLSEIRTLDAEILRDNGKIHMDIIAIPVLDGYPVPLNAEITYDIEQNRVKGTAGADGIPFSRIVAFAPQLSDQVSLSSPLAGDIIFEFEPPSSIIRTALSLNTRNGRIILSGVHNHSLSFDALGLEAIYDAVTAELDVTRLEFRDDGVSAAATLAARDIFDHPAFSLAAAVAGLPVDGLEQYWPETIAVGARAWLLTNIEGGIVEQATLQMSGTLSAGESPKFDLTDLDGAMNVSGVTTHYFRPLPPAVDVAGRAEFGPDAVLINVESGRLDDVNILPSTITISGFDIGQEVVDINVNIQGPVRTVLDVLAHERLGLADRIEPDPGMMSGQVAGNVHFTFPLLKNLRLDDVAYGVSASLDDFGIADAINGWPLSGGRFTLRLDPEGMDLAGTGILAGWPVALKRRDVFTNTEKARQILKLTSRLDAALARTLGLPDDVAMDGIAGIEAEIQQMTGGHMTISADLDLADATLAIPLLQWEKPKGAGGQLHLDVDLQDQRPVRLRSAHFRGAGLVVDAAVEFDPQSGSLQRIHLERLALPDFEVAGSIIATTAGGYTADLSGPRFDVRRFLTTESKDPDNPGPSFTINASIEELVLEEFPTIHRAVMRASHDGLVMDVKIAGRVNNEPVTINYLSDSNDIGHFEIRSEDANAFLSEIDNLDSLVGGELVITGKSVGKGDAQNTRLEVLITNFGIINAPLLAQILNAAVLPALVATLGGQQGIRFNRLKADIIITRDRIKILDSLATGISVGISAKGIINRAQQQTNIVGTLIPAYQLNRLIGKIPILGKLLAGEKDEGLLAPTFHVGGSLAKPDITVNPLTILTPAFLTNFIREEMIRSGNRSSAGIEDSENNR